MCQFYLVLGLLKYRLLQKKGLEGADSLMSIGLMLSLESNFARQELAFLMFEDLFQTITVEAMEPAWVMVESRTRVLTSKHLMPFEKVTKSKMAMLRIANYLLRRLSASHHTVLCGRVMMFLAYAFPLSERSGVNLLGSYNEGNSTDFEDESTFDDTMRTTSSDPVAASSTDRHAVNYTLYSRFWELQRFFMSRVDRVGGCASDVKTWTQFTEVANVVLTAFESNPFSQADLDRESMAARASKRRKTSDAMDTEMEDLDSTNTTSGSFFPTKYLSSSRLLRLQLTDPTLRRNVLCQFSVLLNSLKQLRHTHGIAAPISESLLKKFEDKSTGLVALEYRVEQLLRNTPPDGEKFVQDVDHILARERNWIQWKQAKCPNFERQPTDESEAQDPEELARVRAKAARVSRVQTEVKANRQLWRSNISKWQDTLSTAEANPTPATEVFMEDMEVAIDPENCIEEDYHPKNDPAYCWRGFRLLARTNLEALEKIENGKLEDLVSFLVKRRTGSANEDQSQEKEEDANNEVQQSEKDSAGDEIMEDSNKANETEPEDVKESEKKKPIPTKQDDDKKSSGDTAAADEEDAQDTNGEDTQDEKDADDDDDNENGDDKSSGSSDSDDSSSDSDDSSSDSDSEDSDNENGAGKKKQGSADSGMEVDEK